jgi:hypothetical protein
MSDPQALDWGQLVTFAHQGEDRDRSRALWQACVEVLRNLDAYRPIDFARLPPMLEKTSVSEIVSSSARAATQQEQTGKNVVAAFSTWRAHVTEVEALNASRLHMLASTLRTLADLHAKSAQPEIVLARLADIGAFIECAWGVAIPLSGGDIRAWAQRRTRRYDLLSIEWREL